HRKSLEGVEIHPGRVYVVLEENVVMKDFRFWPDALVCLYGLMYSLQHKYPNCTKNTFGFIQKVLLNLDGDRIKPKVLALKNHLHTNEKVMQYYLPLIMICTEIHE
uniref:Uncharacterized protein n=1 Tax=Hucho hucho TaxID=62062 RepID=A0A4W5PIQ4_9TELE